MHQHEYGQISCSVVECASHGAAYSRFASGLRDTVHLGNTKPRDLEILDRGSVHCSERTDDTLSGVIHIKMMMPRI